MKTDTTAANMRFDSEWFAKVKAVAKENNMTFTDLVVESVNRYAQVLILKNKLALDERERTKYVFVHYDEYLLGGIQVYEQEQTALDESRIAWARLSDEQRENMILFHVAEIKATDTQINEILEKRLDVSKFITKNIKSYI